MANDESRRRKNLAPPKPSEDYPPLTPWERVALLVDLADLDLADVEASAQPGDITNLLYNLHRYVGGEHATLREAERNLTALRPALEPVRRLVAAVADHGAAGFTFGAGRVVLDASAAATTPVGYIGADLPTTVALLAFEDLRTAPAVGRIRRCPEGVCRTIFVARRVDQEYCSRTCANRVATRAYLARKAKKKVKREGRG